jgi:hypothetical protein
MGRALTASNAHPRLLLLAAVVAVALSMLAMHQLSSNHTAADPTAVTVAQLTAHNRGMAIDGHGHGGAYDYAHLSSLIGDGNPSLTEEPCPGCASHQAMAMTCLAALILIAVSWLLRAPTEWRGVRLRRVQLLPVQPEPSTRWVPSPLTLTELSVSRS